VSWRNKAIEVKEPDWRPSDLPADDLIRYSDATQLPLSSVDSHYDSFGRIEKKPPIGFVEAFKQDPAYKIPFVGPVLEGTDMLRVREAAVRLNDEDFDWQRRAEIETFRERRHRRLKTWTAETLKQRDEKLVSDYIDKLAKRHERGYTIRGKIGAGLSILPSWMFEFAMTAGLYQTGKTATKKFLSRYMKNKLLKGTAGWVAGSAVRTTVGMPHRVFAETVRESLHNDEGPWTALAKGWGKTLIEVASEEAGQAIVGGAKWVTGGAINKLPFGKVFLAKVQNAWIKLSPQNTAAVFAKRIATVGGYNGIIGELGEERLASLMHAIVKTESYGLPKGAAIEDRVIAAMKQDLEASNLLAEAAVLSVPGAVKVSIAHLGQYANDKKLAQAIEEQVGVSPDVAKKAVAIKNGKGGIEEADRYLSQAKTEGEAAAKLEQSLNEQAEKAAEAPAKAPEKPVEARKPAEAAPTAPEAEKVAPAPAKPPSEAVAPPQTPADAARAAAIFKEYQRTGDEGLLEDLPPSTRIDITPEEVDLSLARSLDTPQKRADFKDRVLEAMGAVELGEAGFADLRNSLIAYQDVWGETDPLPKGVQRYIGRGKSQVEVLHGRPPFATG
jgi:hypothetical protein